MLPVWRARVVPHISVFFGLNSNHVLADLPKDGRVLNNVLRQNQLLLQHSNVLLEALLQLVPKLEFLGIVVTELLIVLLHEPDNV